MWRFPGFPNGVFYSLKFVIYLKIIEKLTESGEKLEALAQGSRKWCSVKMQKSSGNYCESYSGGSCHFSSLILTTEGTKTVKKRLGAERGISSFSLQMLKMNWMEDGSGAVAQFLICVDVVIISVPWPPFFIVMDFGREPPSWTYFCIILPLPSYRLQMSFLTNFLQHNCVSAGSLQDSYRNKCQHYLDYCLL